MRRDGKNVFFTFILNNSNFDLNKMPYGSITKIESLNV